MLDSAAILCWLTQLSIHSEERVQRSIIVRISDSVEEIERFEALEYDEQILSDRVERLNEIASVSHHFGLQIQRQQDGQVVNTTPGKPPAREIVESCLKMGSEYDQCSMLAHETLGHFRDQQFRETSRLNADAVKESSRNCVEVRHLRELARAGIRGSSSVCAPMPCCLTFNLLDGFSAF